MNMSSSFLALPPELIDSIVRHLGGAHLCAFRLTCRYLYQASNVVFADIISQNRYFTIEENLRRLHEISAHPGFKNVVESLHLYPHLLTWDGEGRYSPAAWEEDGFIRWNNQMLNRGQQAELRYRLRQQWDYIGSGRALDTLENCLSKLPKLSKIEIGWWDSGLLETEPPLDAMRNFGQGTDLSLAHFVHHPGEEAGLRGTRGSCDGDCSLTDDFRLVLSALTRTGKPISELRAHYWSGAGLNCVQIDSVPLSATLLQSLQPSFATLKVLHLCLGFERGRAAANEAGSLTKSKTWLSDLLATTPQLEDLKLVFDGWAQWEVRADPESPDWSGSIFHHLATEGITLPRLRRLDLSNMFVRWQDVASFLRSHSSTLEEISLNRMTMWSVLSWTRPLPETDAGFWLRDFQNLLRSMPVLQRVNLSWLCISGRMMCFHQQHWRHCLGCDNTISTRPTDYGVQTCPHYAFGVNRDVNFLRGSLARKACAPNTNLLKDFLSTPVVMIPMHKAFPLYYQADENDVAAQWLYYDGTVGRFESPGSELEDTEMFGDGHFAHAITAH